MLFGPEGVDIRLTGPGEKNDKGETIRQFVLPPRSPNLINSGKSTEDPY